MIPKKGFVFTEKAIDWIRVKHRLTVNPDGIDFFERLVYLEDRSKIGGLAYKQAAR